MFWYCHHKNLTTPREDEDGEYERCLDCGKRIPWTCPEDGIQIKPPRAGVEREA